MFTLKKDQNINVLCRNDKPCICPFQTKLAIPIPKRTGIIGKGPEFEMAIQEYNCSSNCHLFFEHCDESGNITEVTTQCTGTRFMIKENKKKVILDN